MFYSQHSLLSIEIFFVEVFNILDIWKLHIVNSITGALTGDGMFLVTLISVSVYLSVNHLSNAFVTNNLTEPGLMLTNLATILREAGLNVTEVDGWKTRAHGPMTAVKSIICHDTAGPATGDYPSLPIVRDGRPDLPGPLAQLGLGRSGTWFIIAAGLSYHAGVVIDPALFSNAYAIGIEAEGTGIPATDTGHTYWPDRQYQSYLHGVRALKRAFDVPTEYVKGHKEIASPHGRKIDPNFSMQEFRNAL